MREGRSVSSCNRLESLGIQNIPEKSRLLYTWQRKYTINAIVLLPIPNRQSLQNIKSE